MAHTEPAALGSASASVLTSATADARVRPNAKLIALLALGHLVVDVIQGSIPALLPALKSTYALSYAQAGTIVLVANVTSSIAQPVFGYLADQTARRWLLPSALLLAGVGLGLAGVAPGYGAILFLIVVMGLGVAAYHPEGYRAAASVAGDRRATALSWFSLGGNLGVALGPPFLTALLAGFGTAGSLGLLGPSLAATLLFVAALPVLNRAVVAGQASARAARGVNMPRAMALLILVVTLRSWSTLGFATFVPFYYLDHLGADPREVGQVLFVFLGSGALGTVLAGPLADRWGARPFVRWVFLAALPFGILFLHASGVVAYVLLGLFGAVLTSSFSVSLVLGQAYLPRNSGMAAGLIVGLAMGAGGLGVAFLGGVADHYGVVSALWISALMPLAGFVAARFLPAPREREPVTA